MFLSIVIPIWNDERYLEECLNSCLDQRLSKDQYEIICVDDGSTDRTPEILRHYETRNPNLRIIRKQHGTQYGFGRDIGLAAARGEYVWFVDHDDLIAPGAVDDLQLITHANPAFDRLVFPYYQFYDSFTDEEKKRFINRILVPNDGGHLQDYAVWSSIFRISFLHKNSILAHSDRIDAAREFWGFEQFPVFGGDMIFVEECVDKGARTFIIDGRPLYHYRRHENAETMNLTPEAVQKRNEQKSNSVLLWGHLIYQLKVQYLEEKKRFGHTTPETATKIVNKLRAASAYLSNVSFKYWKRVMRKYSEKDLFLTKKPLEYDFSFSQYRRFLSSKEKWLPHVNILYFSFTKTGAVLYRLLSLPFIVKDSIKILSSKKQSKRAQQLREIGTQTLKKG